MRQHLIRLAKYTIVLAALCWLIGSGSLGWGDFHIRAGGWGYLGLAVGAMFATMLAGFCRFWLLAKEVGVRLTLWESTRIGLIGSFFNSFLFGGVGGDVVKFVYVLRASPSKAAAAASVMMDRVLGLLGLLVLGGIAIACRWGQMSGNPKLQNLTLAVIGLLAGVVFASLLVFISLAKGRRWGLTAWLMCTCVAALVASMSPSVLTLSHPPAVDESHVGIETKSLVMAIGVCLLGLGCVMIVPSCQPGRWLDRLLRQYSAWGEKVMRLVQSTLAYRNSLRVVCIAFLLSLASQAVGVASIFFLGQAMALERSPTAGSVFLAAPPAFVANSLPIPGGGIGVGEAAFQQVLDLTALDSSEMSRGGASVFLALRLLTIVLGLAGLPMYVLDRQKPQAAAASAVAG